ncbi:hypothetical protein FA95DRAFT_1565186 [Auriscalpium vulgare]|uniref:Uncharacterized protein n=1 Tax=Auriscalpium vulgare TaxID=40419 RepID=A0ACB8RCD4_9AGAM|nr:hypothetical protein FA95DRAFT_1565186 [Auriscalpium vulgare]
MLVLLYLVHALLAPAVSSSPVSNDTMPANSTASDSLPSSSRACTDIDSCRTLSNIVLSCLATIFACVWTAVHRNIARPSRDWRSRLLNIVDMAKVVIVTLLVPEWVLAWAVRQYLIARAVAATLEESREDAQRAWMMKKQLPVWLTAKVLPGARLSKEDEPSGEFESTQVSPCLMVTNSV